MLRSLIASLKPPGVDAEHDEIMSWRWWVSVTTIFCTVSVVLLWAVSFGLLPFTSGFATKEDFRSMEIRQIEKDIWEFKEKQCAAIINDNQEALDTTGQILSERINAFRGVAGHPYPVPTCVQIGFRVDA